MKQTSYGNQAINRASKQINKWTNEHSVYSGWLNQPYTYIRECDCLCVCVCELVLEKCAHVDGCYVVVTELSLALDAMFSRFLYNFSMCTKVVVYVLYVWGEVYIWLYYFIWIHFIRRPKRRHVSINFFFLLSMDSVCTQKNELHRIVMTQLRNDKIYKH